MASIHKYSLPQLKTDFPTDEVCLNFIFDALHSRKCSCGGTYKPLFKIIQLKGKDTLSGRKQFQCHKCRFQIAPMAGTIFEKTTTPLTLWFYAIFVFSNAKSGISAKQMERQLGVTYKTAYRILKLIREALGQQKKGKLSGDIEMDEGFFGGKKKTSGKGGMSRSDAHRAKVVVTGAIKRGGEVRAEVSKDKSAYNAHLFLQKHVEPEGTRLLTDKSASYYRVARGFNRHSVNHSKKEFVRGDVHINNMESFWSHVKRSITGTHKVISKKHLQSYLDGFVFLYNTRSNDRTRFSILLGVLLHGVR